MNNRLTLLRHQLAEEELDVILINQPENRRYLSGFTGSAGALLISADDAVFATDFRYYEQVKAQAPDFRLAEVGYEFNEHLADLLSELGAQRVGFEASFVPVAVHHEWIEAAPDVEWVATEEVVERIRAAKDEDEVERVRRAVALADNAFAHAVSIMRPGMTEREIAWEIEVYMRTHGAEAMAFEPIVAGGPNGAMPHARASDRPLHAGEPIVMDIGARRSGYHSDLTRTVCMGQPDGRFQEVYGIVLRAQLAAENAIRAGMSGQDADAVAREIIEEAGYGDNFGHGLGHGVGLAVHEKPRASKISEDTLEAMMLLTIEPGIYIPEWGGVRIEDIVLIREEKAEVLTGAPKEPVISGQTLDEQGGGTNGRVRTA